MTFRSIETIGGNEALTTHHADGKGIVWAIVDSGIDGSHDHFKKNKNLDLPAPLRHRSFSEIDIKDGEIIEVDDDESEEDALIDVYGHGTHLAGIVAGELTANKSIAVKDLRVKSMRGIAPQAKLLSVKILSKTEKQHRNELAFVRALQWLSEINKAPKLLIHGVLIGINFPFDVRNYACGHTPVCETVNDLVRAGMVVVVPAGNLGYRDGSGIEPFQVLYSSITDPGNAELAITVGATHRYQPQLYGASYFSSRGPTLDGRYKPDLLAPGERITSCGVEREGTGKSYYSTYRELDGTSIAAAHVAGAAVALLSVRRELIGKPEDVKQIFLRTATDLQRTREIQGAGLLNLQKAITQKPAQSRQPVEKKLGASLPGAKSETREALRFAENATDTRPKSSKRFVIAFSYSGKHADQVRKIVGEVRRNALLTPEQLFYAPYYQAELSQFNLDKLLVPIYFEESEMVVVFLGEAYQESEWCGLEWQTILKRARKEGGTRVMLLRFDKGEVEGLKPKDGYIYIEKYMPDEVADLILKRLDLIRKTLPV
jgi:subtilisin family serine protease